MIAWGAALAIEGTDFAADLVYAGFWRRALAYFLDEALVTLASVLAAVPIAMLVGSFSSDPRPRLFDLFNPATFQTGFSFIYLLFSIFYYVWIQSKFGTTFAKRWLGVWVIDRVTQQKMTLGQSVARFTWSFFSTLPLGAGYWMAAFQSEKRTFHDLMAQTISIRRGKVKT